MKTQSKKFYIPKNEEFQCIVFDKNCTQENVKCDIQHEDS